MYTISDIKLDWVNTAKHSLVTLKLNLLVYSSVTLDTFYTGTGMAWQWYMALWTCLKSGSQYDANIESITSVVSVAENSIYCSNSIPDVKIFNNLIGWMLGLWLMLAMHRHPDTCGATLAPVSCCKPDFHREGANQLWQDCCTLVPVSLFNVLQCTVTMTPFHRCTTVYRWSH